MLTRLNQVPLLSLMALYTSLQQHLSLFRISLEFYYLF